MRIIQTNVVNKSPDLTLGNALFGDKQSTEPKNFTVKNIPVIERRNIPLEVLGQCDENQYNSAISHRRYTNAKSIETLAINKYRQNGRGICFNDLLSHVLAKHKRQAQSTLKYCLRSKVLFTPYNRKPQQYYPTCLKSEILNKIVPVGVTEVPHLKTTHFGSKEDIILQTLEGYVLPLLPDVPLNIHKLQLMTRIPSGYYNEIAFPSSQWNSAKEHQEIVGTAFVKYIFYANGTVIAFIESSNNPFKLEDFDDLGRLIAFLGQVRDRLIVLLQDRHERTVPDIIQWELKQCDINRDVKVSDWLQLTGPKIQLRHTLHLFRVYIKSKGKDTVCRVEESVVNRDNNRSAVEAINDIFNPTERLEKQIVELDRKIGRLFCITSAYASKCAKSHTIEKVTAAARMRGITYNSDGREINGYFD
jgi:hypothetical protein